MAIRVTKPIRIDAPPPVTIREPDDARAAERHLVARAREGDVGAFEVIYRREAGRVFALALRMTADAARAREVTQDAFVHAWQRLADFRGDAALSSWLHRITVNVVLMSARAERRRTQRVTLVEDEESEDRIEGVVLPRDVEQGIDLERAIAALPPGARRVFVLHDVQGYRHEEIARMTGSAEGTLRAQLHRARRLLMEALNR
jgi:RNA polymerase sigma-70 factor, ECF subfamily